MTYTGFTNRKLGSLNSLRFLNGEAGEERHMCYIYLEETCFTFYQASDLKNKHTYKINRCKNVVNALLYVLNIKH